MTTTNAFSQMNNHGEGGDASLSGHGGVTWERQRQPATRPAITRQLLSRMVRTVRTIRAAHAAQTARTARIDHIRIDYKDVDIKSRREN